MTDHANLAGRSPTFPLPTLDWPNEKGPAPAYWWGLDELKRLTKVYRDYAAYCD